MELRMAQQAYVAAGQGDEFWGSKVASQVAALREELGALRTLTACPKRRARSMKRWRRWETSSGWTRARRSTRVETSDCWRPT